MFWRAVSFIAFELVAGLAGWFAAPSMGLVTAELQGLVLGVVLGGLCWFLIDFSRAARRLRWLRTGDVSEPTLGTGLWSEVSARVRRLALAGTPWALDRAFLPGRPKPFA
jgi:hypothetical protein